mgnify:CR=1 FL=1
MNGIISLDYYLEKKSLPEYEGLKFSFATQTIASGRTKPLGTADAVLAGLKVRSDWKGQKFCVCNSDNLYSTNSLKLLLDDNHPATLIDYDRDALGVEPERVKAFAVIWKDRSSYLTDIVEKPNEEQVLKATDVNQRIGKIINNLSIIDSVIDQSMDGWRLKRLPRIDRDILRLAYVDINFFNTPLAVACDEAVNLANKYSDLQGRKFINGVLRRLQTI